MLPREQENFKTASILQLKFCYCIRLSLHIAKAQPKFNARLKRFKRSAWKCLWAGWFILNPDLLLTKKPISKSLMAERLNAFKCNLWKNHRKVSTLCAFFQILIKFRLFVCKLVSIMQIVIVVFFIYYNIIIMIKVLSLCWCFIIFIVL